MGIRGASRTSCSFVSCNKPSISLLHFPITKPFSSILISHLRVISHIHQDSLFLVGPHLEGHVELGPYALVKVNGNEAIRVNLLVGRNASHLQIQQGQNIIVNTR